MSRWLQWDVPWFKFKERTLRYYLAVGFFRLIMPSTYISHMIVAAAQKGEIR